MPYVRTVKKPYTKYKKKRFQASVKRVIHSELDKKYIETAYSGIYGLDKQTYTINNNTYYYPLCANVWNLICGISQGSAPG